MRLNPSAGLRTTAQVLVFVLTLGYLGYALNQIGWQETWQALPTTPWFYAAFVGLIAIPIYFEWLIYKRLWYQGAPLLCPLLIKRVYNEAIADYSGEAYFFFWARQHIPMPARVLASTIKDSSLLSGLASNLLTLAAAALVLGTNSLHTLALAPQQTIALQLGLLLCFGLSVGLLLFGRRVFGLALGQALQVFGLHLIRHGATLLVQLLQWVAILPHVSFDVWALFLAARLLVGRLPLANKELLFSALALSMLGLTNSAPAVLAAALVANGALMLVAHALLFVVLHARSLHASLNPFRF